MARKLDLRKQRAGTVINLTSSVQESQLSVAIKTVADEIGQNFGVRLEHEKQWFLARIVERLKRAFPTVAFAYHFERSAMRPDGGILSVIDRNGQRCPILIVEVKNQGTNDLRAAEGKGKQAKGNAIERLGKNVIGFRTAFLEESIVPFVCFGDGCDFAPDSSILDRVTTIAMFGPLNVVQLHNSGPNKEFNRGSFFFREKKWESAEMIPIMRDIAEKSLYYYFSKYGKDAFIIRSTDGNLDGQA